MQFLCSGPNPFFKILLTSEITNSFNYYDKYIILDRDYIPDVNIDEESIVRFDKLSDVDINEVIQCIKTLKNNNPRLLLVAPNRSDYVVIYKAWFKFLCPKITDNTIYTYYINSHRYATLMQNLTFTNVVNVKEEDYVDNEITKEEFLNADSSLVNEIIKSLNKTVNKDNIDISCEIEFVRAKFLKDYKSFNIIKNDIGISVVGNLLEYITISLLMFAECTNLENPAPSQELVELLEEMNENGYENERIQTFEDFINLKDKIIHVLEDTRYCKYNIHDIADYIDDVTSIYNSDIDNFDYEKFLKVQLQSNDMGNLSVWFMRNCTEEMAQEFARR